jgi:2,4-dienoyl-CoA reductase-like NADH-dependent reductase (Old Yellow Enzyme family)
MKLFEPITIQGMELKNRIVLPAMIVLRKPSLDKQNPQYVDRERPYYVERAIGGTGTIITGAISVTRFTNDEVWGQPGSVAAFVELLEHLTKDVHQYGAKIGPQLWFTNRYPSGTPQPSPIPQKEEWVAPSPRLEPTKPGFHKLYARPGREARELNPREIRWIIEQFAAAAARAKEAGFDFIEFHGAHGHLGHEFFSPANNRRNDEYGGDLKRRMRFGLECVECIRGAVGSDYPIFFRLGAEDDCPDGVTLADSIAYAVELERAGVDCLDVSVGVSINRPYRFYVSPSKAQPMGTYVHLAAAIKEKVHVPVIAVGRINTPEVAEDILLKGKADLVAIGRQLITDPFWPKKVMEGRTGEIIPCDGCDTLCYHFNPKKSTLDTDPPPTCRKNKRAGKEWQMPLQA